MKKLGSHGRLWLVTFHVFFASVWIGAAISMNFIVLFNAAPRNGRELYAFNVSVKLLDDFVVAPSALGVLITGFLISLLTNWGFFRFTWVTIKWIATIALLISGAFWLLPWLTRMIAISESQLLLPFQDSHYRYCRTMLLIFGNIQVLALANMILISISKPGWKARKIAQNLLHGEWPSRSLSFRD
ncbi:MAG: hypothetical protein AB1847_14815 [bacterium]